jgi:hypothetical protein
MAVVQALGVVCLVFAVLLPTVVFGSTLDPTAEVSVANRSQYAAMVTIDGDLDWQSCSDFEVIDPHMDAHLQLNISSGPECWGAGPRTLTVRNAAGVWTCDWDEAKEHQPIVIVDDGPDCEVTSSDPGLIDLPPPLTPGPPVSPPVAATPLTTP